ncbi:MAG: PTS fructose transporter subunit IIA [Alphaproteobacteria bacterium]|nr:PTS fructose transporter subunit IIA [Alphaproteobacteria bacterium]
MIGMVLVTHENIGGEMLKALNGIVGPQAQAQVVIIGMNDDMGACRDQILSAIKTVNSGSGVVVLADMFGGTPSNLAIAAMPSGNAVVLAGVNLPMLVKLASVRGTMPLLDAAREAEAAGRKYIQLVSETIAPANDHQGLRA